jgi:hypothetical protein
MEGSRLKWLIEYEPVEVTDENGDTVLETPTFSDEDGQPWQAPRMNVRNIFQTDPLVDVVIEKSPHVGVWVWKVDQRGERGRWFGLDDMWAYWAYVMTYTRSPLIAVFGVMEHDHDWGEYVRSRARDHFGIEKNSWKARERRHP